MGVKRLSGKNEHPKIEKEKEEVINKILNKDVSIEDMNRAIRKLKKRKTPGEDLITNEIFMEM